MLYNLSIFVITECKDTHFQINTEIFLLFFYITFPFLNYCVYFLNFILFSDILFQISAQKKSYETDFSPATQLFLKYLSSIIVDQASLADDFSLIIGQRA